MRDAVHVNEGNTMYHSGLNIVIGLYVEISSRWSGGHGGWHHGLLGIFN
ncbi:hypothetical protein GCM10009804_58660 [Kribbella hippodromi]|uniref:Uncharacterized protein n=2 Tax=Kribbella hippodromi TaxID=434347 RepID=A0ABN2E2I8_9ACTN